MKKRLLKIRRQIEEFRERITPGFKKVWAGYGYYISLAALIALFGTAAYLYKNGGGKEAARVIAEVTHQPVQAVMAQPSAAPSPTPEPKQTFIVPVIGDITVEFSPDTLIWNETLNQWRAHPGVDISAPSGAAIMASAAGVVLDAYEDAIWGNVIVLGHDGGYVSRYCSVSTLELVSIGDSVVKGQVISSVGTSAIAESADGAHLHFELTLDGESIAPEFE